MGKNDISELNRKMPNEKFPIGEWQARNVRK